jgi:hypothetical protein
MNRRDGMPGRFRLIGLAGWLMMLAACDVHGRASIDSREWVKVYDHYVDLPANKALVLDTETGKSNVAYGKPSVLDAVRQAVAECKRGAFNNLSRCMLIYMDSLEVGDVSQFYILLPTDIGALDVTPALKRGRAIS